MIPALLIGRKGSVGFPNKNIFPIMGRPMMAYPLMAALNAKGVDGAYLSTDSQEMKDIAINYGAKVIDRPTELCTKEALGEDVFAHGYRHIRDVAKGKIELVVLLFCNAATITSDLIEEGIRVLKDNPAYDSAVSASCYNMWSPLRARKIDKDGLLKPFVPFETFGDPKTLNCDRDSQGDVWFADMSVSIVRPGCLDNLKEGMLPQKWMGRKIYPLKQWGGLDVDYEWQVPQVEYWLKKNGFSDKITPYKK